MKRNDWLLIGLLVVLSIGVWFVFFKGKKPVAPAVSDNSGFATTVTGPTGNLGTTNPITYTPPAVPGSQINGSGSGIASVNTPTTGSASTKTVPGGYKLG